MRLWKIKIKMITDDGWQLMFSLFVRSKLNTLNNASTTYFMVCYSEKL